MSTSVESSLSLFGPPGKKKSGSHFSLTIQTAARHQQLQCVCCLLSKFVLSSRGRSTIVDILLELDRHIENRGFYRV